MHTQLHWIAGPWTGRLAVAARPRGGDWIHDEIAGWRDEGVDVIVSLLTNQELIDLELEPEEETCRSLGVRFISLPIEDRTAPASDSKAMDVIEEVMNLLTRGKNVVAHCRQGVGRASLIAIGALISAGTSLEKAIAEVGKARRVSVPETTGQHEWLKRFESASRIYR